MQIRAFFLLAPLSTLFVSGALADVALNAPGISLGSQSATGVPFRNTESLLGCYKFIFRGTEAKGSTAGAPGASASGNGGLVHYKAFVSAEKSGTPPAHAIQLTFTNIESFNTSPLQTLLLTPAVEFVGSTAPIDVELVWQGEGSGKKPSGFFNILGECQKDPPIPTGSLYFPAGCWELKKTTSNPNPSGTVTILRK